MNVVNLLPDHPKTPQRHSLETLLPDLMRRTILIRSFSLKPFIVSYFDYSSCGEALQHACKSSDVPVSRVNDRMKVIGHYDEGY